MQTYTHSTLLNACLLCVRNQGGDPRVPGTPPGTELCRKCPRNGAGAVLGTTKLSPPQLLTPPHSDPPTPLPARCHCRSVTLSSHARAEMPRGCKGAIEQRLPLRFQDPGFSSRSVPHLSRTLLYRHCSHGNQACNEQTQQLLFFFFFFLIQTTSERSLNPPQIYDS